ncbi:MAG: preprotein translocase subunit SecG [Deltaproteobacteria bacterium]|nr:preprotein translocase subunit SecG [Deltaproteobacteria bacterium]
MQTILSILHYFLCFFLIGTILLQAGKGADIGAAFGAGGSQTVFGPRGAATFLSKITTAIAILFLLTSIGLSKLSRQGSDRSVLEKVPIQQGTTPQETPPIESEQKK